jgi:hypothetical protein
MISLSAIRVLRPVTWAGMANVEEIARKKSRPLLKHYPCLLLHKMWKEAEFSGHDL